MQTEQTAQHTPGPWGCDGDTVNCRTYRAPNAICKLNWRAGCMPDERSANARLIAAAPDLLAALEYLTDLAAGPPGGVTIDQKRAAMDRARAAIAKAKGGAA